MGNLQFIVGKLRESGILFGAMGLSGCKERSGGEERIEEGETVVFYMCKSHSPPSF